MLSSINFLFLLSLGFISWTILCYIHQLEELTDFTKPKQQEIIKEEIISVMNPTPKTEPIPNPNQNNYDLYINFLGIFICIYALAKVTHIAEMYMAKRIRHKIYIPSLQEPDLQDNGTLNDLQVRQENLKWKLNNLEQQNQEIRSKLKNVLDNEATSSRNLDEKVQNVVITNKHINVNRQIYINEGGVLNMTTAEKKQPKFSTIWDKYMDLKDSLDLKTTEQISTPLPVIMSSEELKKIKAIF